MEPIGGTGACRFAEGEAMPGAEDYRRYASECLKIAQRASDLGDRARLLELASAFNDLAAKLDAAKTRGEDDSQAKSSVKP
jgi:hypothetical protein